MAENFDGKDGKSEKKYEPEAGVADGDKEEEAKIPTGSSAQPKSADDEEFRHLQGVRRSYRPQRPETKWDNQRLAP